MGRSGRLHKLTERSSGPPAALCSVCDAPLCQHILEQTSVGPGRTCFCSDSLFSAFNSTVGSQGTPGLEPPWGHLPLVESKLKGVARAQVLLLTLRL